MKAYLLIFLPLLLIACVSPIETASHRQTAVAPTVESMLEAAATDTPTPTTIVLTPTPFVAGAQQQPDVVTPTPSVIFMDHVVQRGESLGKISRLYGVPISTIQYDNGIHNPNLIYAGQVLRIRINVYSTPIPPGVSG